MGLELGYGVFWDYDGLVFLGLYFVKLISKFCFWFVDMYIIYLECFVFYSCVSGFLFEISECLVSISSFFGNLFESLVIWVVG